MFLNVTETTRLVIGFVYSLLLGKLPGALGSSLDTPSRRQVMGDSIFFGAIHMRGDPTLYTEWRVAKVQVLTKTGNYTLTLTLRKDVYVDEGFWTHGWDVFRVSMIKGVNKETYKMPGKFARSGWRP